MTHISPESIAAASHTEQAPSASASASAEVADSKSAADAAEREKASPRRTAVGGGVH